MPTEDEEEMRKALSFTGKKLFQTGEEGMIGKRPADWPPLHMEEIRKRVGFGRIGAYDRVLVNVNCRTDDEAVDLIKKRHRIDDEDYALMSDVMSQYAHESAACKYLPKRYSDLEDDNYYRQEVKTLNG